ncbi:MAG: hypothetical protein IPH80_33945 [Myxococcales bacterium]|nr:hypothetical protein [Myxococcales bacterium]
MQRPAVGRALSGFVREWPDPGQMSGRHRQRARRDAGLREARGLQSRSGGRRTMASYQCGTDMRTGEMVFIGKSGREDQRPRPGDDRRAAKAGDVAAQAVRRDLDFGIDDEAAGRAAAAQALLAQQIHDCPECQAARARARSGTRWAPTSCARSRRRRATGDYPSRETRRRKIPGGRSAAQIARAARAANR